MKSKWIKEVSQVVWWMMGKLSWFLKSSVGFFLACRNIGRLFDFSFPAWAFLLLLLLKWRIAGCPLYSVLWTSDDSVVEPLSEDHPNERTLVRDHPEERSLMRDHLMRPPWWETTLIKDHSDERPPWWKTSLMRDCPYERPPWWETTLLKDHPDERRPWWKISVIRGHPDEGLPWWKSARLKDYSSARPPWWETTLMRDHPDERPPWWETSLTRRYSTVYSLSL